MSFSVEQTDIGQRFQQVRNYLSFIKTQESSAIPPADSDEVKILRGLFYVHLYGAFEKSINDCVEQYLQKINSLQLVFSHCEPGFLPTAMDARFTSLQAGESKRWKRRVDFINEMVSTGSCQINNSVFSSQLQNTWASTLLEVSLYLGITQNFVTNQPDLHYLDEVVEKRNQVAHGRNNPLSVGSSGRSADLEIRFEALNRLVSDFAAMLELNLNNLEFISVSHRSNYLARI